MATYNVNVKGTVQLREKLISKISAGGKIKTYCKGLML